MATIGAFRKSDDSYTGNIHTLAFSTGVVIKPVDESQRKASAPTHRVYAGQADIGAGWEKVAEKSGSSYLSLTLDDPTLAKPISANLVQAADGDGYDLIWSRKR